jgi:lysophospholipid acyltransferase (LPLAT)-like uncharacterized protein
MPYGMNKGMGFVESCKIGVISTIGYWVIRLIGATLRWDIKGLEQMESIYAAGMRIVLVTWHGRIFMGTYFLRQRGIAVMTSQNRDGEYIARVIERFGYSAVRGSSTRGSRGAIVEMLRTLKMKKDVCITLDGPRGPRYIAKPGAAYLARKSGNPVMPFITSVEKKWVMKSWDHFMIPKPFTRAYFSIGDPIYIGEHSSDEEIKRAESQIQQKLNELRNQGDSHWGGPADQ